MVSLTNVALLGSSQMELDYNELITDKRRYQDMFRRLPGGASQLNDNSGHEMSLDCGRSTVNIGHAVDSWEAVPSGNILRS